VSEEAPAKVKANQHESYWTFTILAILFPPIALLLGIVFMTKDNKLDRKLGEHLLAFSILFMILYGILWAVWSAMAANSVLAPTYTPYQ